VLVHVNIGHLDANLDLAEKYEVPLRRGVPALAVLSETAICSTARKAASSSHAPHGILDSNRFPGAMEAREGRLLGRAGELLNHLFTLAGFFSLSPASRLRFSPHFSQRDAVRVEGM